MNGMHGINGIRFTKNFPNADSPYHRGPHGMLLDEHNNVVVYCPYIPVLPIELFDRRGINENEFQKPTGSGTVS